MKLFQKKSVIYAAMVLAAVFSFYLRDILTFTAGQKILLGLGLALFICAAALVPCTRTKQKRMEERDERDRFIAMKCSESTLETVKDSMFLTQAGCVIGFGLTGEDAFLWVLCGAVVPWGVMKIAFIVNAFRYDSV